MLPGAREAWCWLELSLRRNLGKGMRGGEQLGLARNKLAAESMQHSQPVAATDIG